jgi:hypothetical protein
MDGAPTRPRWGWLGIILLFCAVVSLWVLTPWIVGIFGESPAEMGQLGDLFGSINALFSGLAFAGVVVAILLQRQELSLQRQELTLTRQELERSASAQEKSHNALQATMHAQTFKVALDFLDSGHSLDAKRFINQERGRMTHDPPVLWTVHTLESAETVVRSYESVGALIARQLIPADYLTSTRSVSIVDYWEFLKPFVFHIRQSRGDIYFGRDFEMLAGLAADYLKKERTESERALQRDGL